MAATENELIYRIAPFVLKTIGEKKCIKVSEVPLYCQKIDYILTNFLEAASVNSREAISCLRSLTEIRKKMHTFPASFHEKIFRLHDCTTTGDELTRNEATTKLLLFFSFESPASIEQKNKLLTIIQNMPDFSKRESEVSRVIYQIANHYDRNQQFCEDTNLSVLRNISDIIHKVCDPLPSFGRAHSRTDDALKRERFENCITIIKIRAPELYSDKWEKKFFLPPPPRSNMRPLPEPVDVFFKIAPSRPHYPKD